jgi:hypothetical protein
VYTLFVLPPLSPFPLHHFLWQKGIEDGIKIADLLALKYIGYFRIILGSSV